MTTLHQTNGLRSSFTRKESRYFNMILFELKSVLVGCVGYQDKKSNWEWCFIQFCKIWIQTVYVLLFLDIANIANVALNHNSFWRRTWDSFWPKTSLTPFAIHILNRLDMRIQNMHGNIPNTYAKGFANPIEWSILWLFWVISEVGSPVYIAKSAIFKI